MFKLPPLSDVCGNCGVSHKVGDCIFRLETTYQVTTHFNHLEFSRMSISWVSSKWKWMFHRWGNREMGYFSGHINKVNYPFETLFLSSNHKSGHFIDAFGFRTANLVSDTLAISEEMLSIYDMVIVRCPDRFVVVKNAFGDCSVLQPF